MQQKRMIRLVTASVALAFTLVAVVATAAESRSELNLNLLWKFHLNDPAGQPSARDFDDAAWEDVALPHTLKEVSLNLDNVSDSLKQARFHRFVGWYRRHLELRPEQLGGKVFLVFHGVMQTAEVWVNGEAAGKYEVSGYDSFHFDITGHCRPGANVIAVKVDNTVNPRTPPDGPLMNKDFILFGGIYRDVILITTDSLHVTFPWDATEAGVRITIPEISTEQAVVKVQTVVANEGTELAETTVLATINDAEGQVIQTLRETRPLAAGAVQPFALVSRPIPNPKLWSPDRPYLYTAVTTVLRRGAPVDEIRTPFGMRWVRFDKNEGFFLNGQHLKLVGVNYHQTWPFVGNAVPRDMQRRDIEMIKAMGVNWVRLSHYPHSPAVLNYLDELGLLASEEAATWMGTGSDEWLNNLDMSLRRMIRRDRNHPSIFIWNANINHQPANPHLKQIVMEEDPSVAPRGGNYRYIGADFPALPHNFQHGLVSGGGALTQEHTGHMFPQKRGIMPGDLLLTMRHLEMTDAAYRLPDNSGLAIWCMFDYNSFHNCSERGVTWHGVADLQRLPKTSWYWHRSELTDEPMAHLVRYAPDAVKVFSNLEQVRLSQDLGRGYEPGEVRQPDAGYVLHHPPYSFAVNPAAVRIRAEGLKNGRVQAVDEWRQPGKPAALRLTADRPRVYNDGSDFTRIILTVVDEQGTVTPAATGPVAFTLSGPGRLIGENPAPIREGYQVILAAACWDTGKLIISASVEGLKNGTVTVDVADRPAGYYVDAALPKPSPTRQVSPTVSLPTKNAVGRESGKPDSMPDPFSFTSVNHGSPDTWEEAPSPIMISGINVRVPISIVGGEYKINSGGQWTSRPTEVINGDAVFIRVRSANQVGAVSKATLTVGESKASFEVTTETLKEGADYETK